MRVDKYTMIWWVTDKFHSDESFPMLTHQRVFLIMCRNVLSHLYAIVSVYDCSCFICVVKNIRNVHVIQGRKGMSFFIVVFLSVENVY